MRFAAAIPFVLVFTCSALAGVHDSGNVQNALPAEWRGFLLDHRALRVAMNPQAGGVKGSSPLRDRYAEAAIALQAKAKASELTADESADLGALLIRIGQAEKAVAVLRPAAREHPQHFRIAANLGTAWQLAGNLEQAAASLEEAVALAPPEWKDAETLHLKLVRLRAKEKRDPGTLDALFDLTKLPDNALALTQQLCVWLPTDGRLLWLLAEVAHASGDVRTAATLLDGCVTEFNLASEVAREHRKQYRAAAEAEHDKPAPKMKFASTRVLAKRIDEATLPKIDPTGVNRLPWAVLGETEVGKKFAVTPLKYAADLDGKTVTLSGYMSPVRADEVTEFLLLEYAVGCWFCEAPAPTQIVQVETTGGKAVAYTRGPVVVTGTFHINRTDPERLLFRLDDATVKLAE